jgi:hypothetical protein
MQRIEYYFSTNNYLNQDYRLRYKILRVWAMLGYNKLAKPSEIIRVLLRHRHSDLILICCVILSFSALIIVSSA